MDTLCLTALIARVSRTESHEITHQIMVIQEKKNRNYRVTKESECSSRT